MKLILGGGGDETTSLQSHKLFFDQLSSNKRALYIPIAILASSKYTPESCLTWFSGAFREIGLKNIDMITSFDSYEEDTLAPYDGVYIGGGNAFKLLKEIKETGFDTLIYDYMNGPGVIYGGSAGAIVFGKDLATAEHADPNEVGLEDFAGFNSLNGHSVWCHYDPNNEDMIFELIDKGEKIVAIEEDSALYVDDESVMAVGSGVHLYLPKGKTDFSDGQSVELH